MADAGKEQPRPCGEAVSHEAERSPLCEERFHQLYRLSHKLGKGAFASVYMARKIGVDKPVAVKVTDLREGKTDTTFGGQTDTRRLKEATKEVSLLKLVAGKEHVITFVEGFLEGNIQYIVLEKCDASIFQVLERTPELTESALARVLLQMLKGVAAVHDVDVVHRDLKPDNFLCVGGHATVKLCDFGLASVLPGGNGGALGLTGVNGTPPFMAPEMLRAEPYGTAVDVWSLGVIAYTLFFGRFPYMPVEQTGPAMKAAIRAGSPVPTFPARPGLQSSEATCLIRDLLCREQGERPGARAALRYSLFRPRADPTVQQGSLRPMLLSAVRAGLFETRLGRRHEQSDLDVRLALLQEGSLGPPPGALAAHEKAEGACRPCRRPAPSDISTELDSHGVFSDGSSTNP